MKSKNEEEYFAREAVELLHKQRERAHAAALEAERKTHFMKCPKDGYDLTTRKFHGVEIETCSHCGGMWVDASDIDAVSHEERSSVITRVLADALATFLASPRPGHADHLVHEPGNPSQLRTRS
jgi:Zn-finger nucleic acid-binding protein